MEGLSALIGIILVQGSTLFQVVKFIRKKRTEGVSIAFWWAIFFGLISYLFYSISINDRFYIASNSIGILLSSISIGLYYYYKHRQEQRWRKERKNGEHIRLDCVSGNLSASMADFVKRTKGNVHPPEGGAVFPRKAVLRRDADKDNRNPGVDPNSWQVQEKKMLVNAKGYYVNVCNSCYKYWVNYQGTVRYVTMERAESMIFAGAKRRYCHCYRCRKEAENARQDRQDTKK